MLQDDSGIGVAEPQTGSEPTPPAAPVAAPEAPGTSAPAQPSAAPAAQPPSPPSRPLEKGPVSVPLLRHPPDAPPSPAAPPTPGTTAAAATVPEWTFTADEREFRVEGSAVDGDGNLTIPADQRQHVEALLAEGIAHRGSFRQVLADKDEEIRQLRSNPPADVVARHPEVLRYKALSDRLLGLLKQGPEKVAEWLDAYQTNYPAMLAQADAAVEKQQREALEVQLADFKAREHSATIVPQMERALDGALAQLAAKYPAVNLPVFSERLYGDDRLLDAVAYEVPAAERPRGPEPGEQVFARGPNGELYIVNVRRLEVDMQYHQRLLDTAARTNAAGAAAATGQPVAGAPAAPPPSVAGAGAAPVPTAAPPTDWKKIPKEQIRRALQDGTWKDLGLPEYTE